MIFSFKIIAAISSQKKYVVFTVYAMHHSWSGIHCSCKFFSSCF